MNQYLSTFGYQGPTILLIVIILGLIYNHITNPYLYGAVILWQLMSHLLNVIIKNIIKAPRPDSQPEELAKQRKSITYKNYLTIHRNFGMPSGHAQATVSELTFIALYFKEPILSAAAAIMTAITLWQRYTTKRHSLMQLLAGSAMGLAVGLAFYAAITFVIIK
jgi:membrane-associated phospholipid phosphatase